MLFNDPNHKNHLAVKGAISFYLFIIETVHSTQDEKVWLLRTINRLFTKYQNFNEYFLDQMLKQINFNKNLNLIIQRYRRYNISDLFLDKVKDYINELIKSSNSKQYIECPEYDVTSESFLNFYDNIIIPKNINPFSKASLKLFTAVLCKRNHYKQLNEDFCNVILNAMLRDNRRRSYNTNIIIETINDYKSQFHDAKLQYCAIRLYESKLLDNQNEYNCNNEFTSYNPNYLQNQGNQVGFTSLNNIPQTFQMPYPLEYQSGNLYYNNNAQYTTYMLPTCTRNQLFSLHSSCNQYTNESYFYNNFVSNSNVQLSGIIHYKPPSYFRDNIFYY